MYEFLISTSVVALAEMGDKTQLLALLLAARFRKPIPILIAILLATTINHGLSAVLGQWITTVLSPEILLWILALGFIGSQMNWVMKLKASINGRDLGYLVQPLSCFFWQKLVIKPRLPRLPLRHVLIVCFG